MREEDFPIGPVVKNPHTKFRRISHATEQLSPCTTTTQPEDARDACLIPGSVRSPREGNGNPLQYSCLGNPMDSGAWWATKSQT